MAMVPALLLLWLGTPLTLQVSEFRCGVNLVHIGDTRALVRERCGEPTRRQIHRADFRGRFRPPPPLEDWIYDRGSTEFVRVLSFNVEIDSLLDIRLGGYGL